MSKSHDYEVMTSLPPEAEYPMELFEWVNIIQKVPLGNLPQEVVSKSDVLGTPWLEIINFQTTHFYDFEHFKIDNYFAYFVQI